MPEIFIKNGGAWRRARFCYRNVAGTWRRVLAANYRAGGVWRPVHSGAIPINLTISSSVNNVNLFTLAGSPSDVCAVTLTINAGVTVGSSASGLPALTTGTGWQPGSTLALIDNGLITGGGGMGGTGIDGVIDSGESIAGEPGKVGGDAIELLWPMSIDNTNGNIFGGGGGGGGGGGFERINNSCIAGGGGGGGAGLLPGRGGSPGYESSSSPATFAEPGQVGSSTQGGLGGAGEWIDDGTSMGGVEGDQSFGGEGGKGGGPGAAGWSGSAASTTGTVKRYFSAGAGGAAGYAVRRNGNAITWLAGNNPTQIKGSVG